jgi:hypothetical protein
MSTEETSTPKLLSSLARSCFLTRADVLYPVSTGIVPSLTPSARAESSSGVSKLVAMEISDCERNKGAEQGHHWVTKEVK